MKTPSCHLLVSMLLTKLSLVATAVRGRRPVPGGHDMYVGAAKLAELMTNQQAGQWLSGSYCEL